MELQYTLKEIKPAALKFWKAVADKKIFSFQGSMGSGKTTFIHALCDVKGVTDVVGSPTFSIINEYAFSENGQVKKIFHIDLYRLKNEEEAVRAGVEDCLYSNHICFVEWPEKAPGLFPVDTIQVFIEVTGLENRRLTIKDK